MKPFDLPYNFDINLINFYDIYFNKNINRQIHSIYLPPYLNDYITAKSNQKIHTTYNTLKIKNIIPTDDQEYQEHISYINKLLPDTLMLLLQQNELLMPYNILEKYLKLNIKKFCVGSLNQAKMIKEIDPSIEITGSITMKMMPNDLIEQNNILNQYFDNFVLWFPYNRNIKMIQQLPPNFNYILLLNCTCSVNCQGTFHWFAAEDDIIKCPTVQEKNIQKQIIIPRNFLYLFNDYINIYKLQGREFPTKLIIEQIIYYNTTIPKNFSLLKESDFQK